MARVPLSKRTSPRRRSRSSAWRDSERTATFEPFPTLIVTKRTRFASLVPPHCGYRSAGYVEEKDDAETETGRQLGTGDRPAPEKPGVRVRRRFREPGDGPRRARADPWAGHPARLARRVDLSPPQRPP